MKSIKFIMTLAFILGVTATTCFAQTGERKLNIEGQMYLRKAIEAAHWSMPWNNFSAMEEGFERELGSHLNDVVYYSKPQDWRTVITTPNNTTLYVMSFWDTNISGPVVVDVPPTTERVGLFGTLMDSWQRPLIDVGGQGHDKGKGAKYLILPVGYKGEIPEGYVPLESKNHKGYFLFRTLLKGFSEENLAAGNKFIKGINVYPLSQAKTKPESKHHDAYGKKINAVSEFSDKYYDSLNKMIQAETIEERDMAARGMLEAIGIVKGKAFKPTKEQRELLEQAAMQVQDESKYSLNHPPAPYWENSTWAHLLDPTIVTETDFSWQYDSYLHYRYRSEIYYAAFSSVKKFGTATMYLVNGSDSKGELLKGQDNYTLHLPANPPVKQFWSVLNYDLNTGGFIENTPKAGVSSLDEGLVKNADGSVTIYFGPKAPEGREANWAPTVEGVDYFLLFRFYGPTENAYNNSWKLGDIEKIKEEAVNLPARNPWLTDSVYPTSHHNPGQTDASPINGPIKGHTIQKKNIKTVLGLFNSQPVTKKIGEDRVLIAAGVLGLRKIYATGDAFEEVSFTPYPGFEALAMKTTQASLDNIVKKLDAARRAKDDAAILSISSDMEDLGFSFKTIANGVYHFVDKDQFHYCVYGGVNLLKSTDHSKVKAPLEIVKTVNITEKLPPKLAKSVNRIVGAGLTYNGNIAVAAPGMVALLDRDLEMLDYITFPGEFVDNSIALDESGIYVVTSEHMYKIVWTGKKLSFADSDGGWKSGYNTIDAETALKMGAASRGAGTTPALMGHGDDEDKLVLISDADANGTNLTAFWRNDIPKEFKQIPGTKSRRIAGQIRFKMSQLTAEASAVIKGYGAILANSTFKQPSKKLGDIVGNIFTAGVTRPAPVGLQKFQWDPKANKFSVAWTDKTIDNTDWMVPVVSKNNILYLPSKDGLTYEYVGLDWFTGKRVASWKMPTDSSFYSTSLGIAYFLEDGDLVFAGFFNTKRVNF